MFIEFFMMKVCPLYNHKQLRDMIEYVDFDNTRTLQKEPQWRVDGTYKKQLEANSVYIPWYMKKYLTL